MREDTSNRGLELARTPGQSPPQVHMPRRRGSTAFQVRERVTKMGVI